MSKEIRTAYWCNGTIEYKIPYRQGERHGVARYWYENRNVEYEITCHRNQKHGVEKHWDKDGNIEKVLYFLYNREVFIEECRKHQLIEHLLGLDCANQIRIGTAQ